MRLVYLLLADYANTTADGKLNVMGVFNSIAAKHFPARHPNMFITAKLEPEIGDSDQMGQLTITLEDSDGHEINTTALPIEAKRNPIGITLGVNIILQITDTVLGRPGLYQISLYLNNEPLGRVGFTAAQV